MSLAGGRRRALAKRRPDRNAAIGFRTRLIGPFASDECVPTGKGLRKRGSGTAGDGSDLNSSGFVPGGCGVLFKLDPTGKGPF
ncbi:MAG: hypothetical protein ABSG56_28140 [Bryobacteraceae bacterium]